MSRLQVINITTSPQNGGAEKIVRQTHSELLLQDHDAFAIYFSKKSDIALGKNEFVLGKTNKSLLNIFRLRKLIKKIIANNDDKFIVHAHLTWPLYYTYFATIGMNVKLIYTEHSTHNKRRNIKLLRPIEKWIYSKYDNIICISEGTQLNLLKWLENKKINTKVIFNGIPISHNIPVRVPPKPDKKVNLISIGSLTQLKNFSITIKAVSNIRSQIGQYRIYGQGPERKNLEQLIKSLQLEDIVILAGWTDDPIEKLIENDILLIPSLWEGFGLVGVEGMSTGITIAYSNCVGLKEIMPNHTEGILPIQDFEHPESWVHGILSLKETIAKEKVVYSEIQNYSRNFSSDKMIESYIKMYRDTN